MDSYWQLLIADFGLARIIAPAPGFSGATPTTTAYEPFYIESLAGSFDYMAPEMLAIHIQKELMIH